MYRYRLLELALMVLAWSSPAMATTYYVATTGSDSNTCVQAQSSLTPKLTISQGVACISGGDTLIIAAGTYTGQQIYNPPAGSDGAYTIIKGDPSGARPLLNPTGELPTGQRGLYCDNGSSCHHIEIRHLEVYTAYNYVKLFGSTALGYAHHIRIIDNVFHDTYDSGILISTSTTGYVGGDHYIAQNEFYNTGSLTPNYGPGFNTIYDPGSDTIIERNYFHNLHHGVGIWYSGTYIKNVTVRYNLFKQIGRVDLDSWQSGSSGYTAVHVSVPGGGHQIYGNVVYDSCSQSNCSAFSLNPLFDDAAAGPVSFYNNSIYNLVSASAYCIKNSATAGGPYNIKNNICLSAGNGIQVGTGGVSSNNRTTGTATDVWTNPSGGDFTLKSGSAAIDAGTAIGLSYNGSAPDQGAHETFTFASCEVPADSTSSIRITFNNNLNPPLLNPTTFTARKNGSSNVLSGAATVIGDNVVNLPLTDSYSAGDAAYITWSSGGLSDSALIGGTSNQPFVTTLTNQPCTNNAAGAPAFTLTQADFEYHGVYGLEASPDVRGAENATTYAVVKGGAARIRLSVVCGVADCAPVGLYLYYAQGGAYAVVPNEFTSGNIAFCGSTYTGSLIPSNGAPTTNQLSTSGTFVAGGVIFSSQATPTVTLATGNKTELEYCVKFDTDATGDYTFRLYTQEDAALDTYSHTPTVTMVATQANMP